MPYVQRDLAGRIVAVSATESESTPEWVDEGSHDLNAFLLDMALGKEAVDGSAVRALSESDLAMIRVVEDVIDLLIEQNLLRFTDLPPAAQEKLMERRSLRQTLNPLALMGSDDGVI
ncbi:MAG: hypothetical protein HGA75_01605 [Thiobacillus sp.]|nr:hypothetical protein [Thiobacillus sp.]